jgi:transposase
MQLVELTDAERTALVAAQQTVRTVREWRRYQAVRLLAAGQEPAVVAQALGCSASAVYYWAQDWREQGLAGLAEGPHAGHSRRLDTTAEAEVEQALAEDPQAHGYAATDWTVPLLHTELSQRGYAASAHTLRRTLHRLGYRWKRPKYALGRPDPAYAAKKGRWWSK